mmetsp:Transcript_99018/g.319192  ORF Transcript_99018/g.319192 Transcript_99018/m.319192 type:complete len:103 (-) Transcript_99018:5-313(-)
MHCFTSSELIIVQLLRKALPRLPSQLSSHTKPPSGTDRKVMSKTLSRSAGAAIQALSLPQRIVSPTPRFSHLALRSRWPAPLLAELTNHPEDSAPRLSVGSG